MRVVGVDPGLAACGYAVVDADGRKAEALAYGCWQTQAGVRVELRLRELYLALADLLAQYKPDAVALEECPGVGDPRQPARARAHAREKRQPARRGSLPGWVRSGTAGD